MMLERPFAVCGALLLLLFRLSAVSQVVALYSEGPNSQFVDWEFLNCNPLYGAVRMEAEHHGTLFVTKYMRRKVEAEGWVLLVHDFTGTTCMCTWPTVSVGCDTASLAWYRHLWISPAFDGGPGPTYEYPKQLMAIRLTRNSSYITYNGATAMHEAHSLLRVPSAYLLDSSCVVPPEVYGKNVSRSSAYGHTIVYGPFETRGTHVAVHLVRDERFMWGFWHGVFNGDTVHYRGNSPGTAITFGGLSNGSGYTTVELCFTDSFPDFTTDEITFFDVDTAAATAVGRSAGPKQIVPVQSLRRESYDLRGRPVDATLTRAYGVYLDGGGCARRMAVPPRQRGRH